MVDLRVGTTGVQGLGFRVVLRVGTFGVCTGHRGLGFSVDGYIILGCGDHLSPRITYNKSLCCLCLHLIFQLFHKP